MNYLVPALVSLCCALISGWYAYREFNQRTESCRDLAFSALTALGLAVALFVMFGFWRLLDGTDLSSYLFPDMPVRRGERGIYIVYILASYGVGTGGIAALLRLNGRCPQV